MIRVQFSASLGLWPHWQRDVRMQHAMHDDLNSEAKVVQPCENPNHAENIIRTAFPR